MFSRGCFQTEIFSMSLFARNLMKIATMEFVKIQELRGKRLSNIEHNGSCVQFALLLLKINYGKPFRGN